MRVNPRMLIHTHTFISKVGLIGISPQFYWDFLLLWHYHYGRALDFWLSFHFLLLLFLSWGVSHFSEWWLHFSISKSISCASSIDATDSSISLLSLLVCERSACIYNNKWARTISATYTCKIKLLPVVWKMFRTLYLSYVITHKWTEAVTMNSHYLQSQHTSVKFAPVKC